MSVRDSAIALLTDWQPPDRSQDSLRNAVLAFLDAREDACLRACVPGHITASALVLDDTGGQAFSGDAEQLQRILRKVDPPAAEVLTDVPQEIGQLERDPEVAGISGRRP